MTEAQMTCSVCGKPAREDDVFTRRIDGKAMHVTCVYWVVRIHEVHFPQEQLSLLAQSGLKLTVPPTE